MSSKQFLRIGKWTHINKQHIVSITQYAASSGFNKRPQSYEIKTTALGGSNFLYGSGTADSETITVPITDTEDYNDVTRYLAENSN